jgi:hypothetical protein
MFGGFLIYYTPRLRVFVDDRFELYGDEGLMNVIKAEPEKFHQWAAKYGFEMALIASGSKYDRILREARDWQIVGETKSSVLFQKK